MPKRNTQEIEQFVSGLKESARTGSEGHTFDSAAATHYVNEGLSGNGVVPESLSFVLDEAGERSGAIVRAILDGVASYESQHGVDVPADVIEQALHSAFSTIGEARRQFQLDSAACSLHPWGCRGGFLIMQEFALHLSLFS